MAEAEEIKHSCQYCNTVFSDKTALCRHRNHFCKMIPDDIKAKIGRAHV